MTREHVTTSAREVLGRFRVSDLNPRKVGGWIAVSGAVAACLTAWFIFDASNSGSLEDGRRYLHQLERSGAGPHQLLGVHDAIETLAKAEFPDEEKHQAVTKFLATPDGATLYHGDSRVQTVWRYEVRADGTLSEKVVFAETATGSPDGLAVAEERCASGPGLIKAQRSRATTAIMQPKIILGLCI